MQILISKAGAKEFVYININDDNMIMYIWLTQITPVKEQLIPV